MTTPLRRQYLEIKRRFPQAIVFFRLGDFYETFDQDAELVSRELDIVLTSRPIGKGQRIPLAGIPHHALDGYLAKLIAKGYKVAICEQVSDAAKEQLSVIIEEMNERFGHGLTEEHRLVLDQYEGAFLTNTALVQAARANDDVETFKKIVFEPAFLDTIITQMGANEEIFKLILADDRMRALFSDYLAQTVYDQIREAGSDEA